MLAGGIQGSLLLALAIPESKWGYLLFLIGSIAGVQVGRMTKIKSLTILNFYFTIVNGIGVYRWILM